MVEVDGLTLPFSLEPAYFYSLLISVLEKSCPVLSGNMKDSIKTTKMEEDELKIRIEPKFYDLNHWKKTGAIVFKQPEGITRTSYAQWVNDVGAFGMHNDSEHWVNRAIYEVAQAVKRDTESMSLVFEVEVINELEL